LPRTPGRDHPPARLVVVALGLAALALGSARAALQATASLNLPRALTEPASQPAAPPVTPRRAVLLVLIDGLRADVASQLPFLRELTGAGARADLWVDPPSFSSPQYVALLTGVPPRDSGVRTNRSPHQVLLDNVPRRLARAGRRAVEVGDEVDWWQRLFGADFAATAVVAPRELRGAAVTAMAGADLTLVHLCEVDAAGHRHGGASASYREAALRQDEQVRLLSAAFGWPARPVVVVTDHGHVLAGGHGGDEPDARHAWMIMSGAGARPGAVVAQARPVDVAPTLAALLGVSAPADAQGRTLVELLSVDAATAGALTATDRARIERATRATAEGRRRQEAGTGRSRAERAAALLLAVGLCGLALRAWGRHLRVGLGLGLWSCGLGAGAYLVVCGRVSFSAARDTTTLLALSALVGAAACAVVFARPLARVWRRQLSRGEACALGAGAAVGSAPLAALAFVCAGAFAPRLECEPAWVAAGPLVSYALFAPSALAALALCGMAVTMAGRHATTATAPPAPNEQKRT
jgi:Type I phosphodiesterase / nucleotide pyrophosphatase